MPHLRCEIERGLATIVLNNPPQNRLAPQMVDELSEIVNVVGRSEVRAVLQTTTTARELYDEMLRLDPNRVNPGALWASARGVKR